MHIVLLQLRPRAQGSAYPAFGEGRPHPDPLAASASCKSKDRLRQGLLQPKVHARPDGEHAARIERRVIARDENFLEAVAPLELGERTADVPAVNEFPVKQMTDA